MGYLRKSNSKDLRHVMNNMRGIDKIEAYYQCGCEPEDALALTYINSEITMTAAGDEDQPMGLCGVMSNGCIWFTATDELFDSKKYRIQLIRKGKTWVKVFYKNMITFIIMYMQKMTLLLNGCVLWILTL